MGDGIVSSAVPATSPRRPPPGRTMPFLPWLRRNLFGGVGNAILTGLAVLSLIHI